VSDEDSRNYSGGSQLHTPRIYLENEGEMGGGGERFSLLLWGRPKTTGLFWLQRTTDNYPSSVTLRKHSSFLNEESFCLPSDRQFFSNNKYSHQVFLIG
jgi:hypothetical protein